MNPDARRDRDPLGPSSGGNHALTHAVNLGVPERPAAHPLVRVDGDDRVEIGERELALVAAQVQGAAIGARGDQQHAAQPFAFNRAVARGHGFVGADAGHHELRAGTGVWRADGGARAGLAVAHVRV